MDKRLSFRVYERDGLFELNEEKKHPIVEDMVFENDYIMLVAKEKVGKSILAMQLACDISSGKPFLETFDVPKARRVWYFATEGKDEDMKQRLINMSLKYPCNKENLKLICSAGFRFNSKIGVQDLNYLLEKYKDELPKVIIIDALYMAISGSLKDDLAVNDFTYRVRQFAEACDAATIIVHHARRPIVFEGKSSESKTDDDIFGSAFLKASVDHCFYMGKYGDHKYLKCTTQRSGGIAEEIQLELVEPVPLYFRVIGGNSNNQHKVRDLLKREKDGLTVKEFMKYTGFTRPVLYRAIKDLGKIVNKSVKRPIVYTLI